MIIFTPQGPPLCPGLQARGQGQANATTTAEALAGQWINPSDISTILMVIGGEVVQKALAQGTAKWYFTPVCFSFGWVSYIFTALIGVIGEGRLLPPPDFPAKVINLDSGYVRENKNWVIGRILRDLESRHSKEDALINHPLKITVYDALPSKMGASELPWSTMHTIGSITIGLQLCLAIIPIVFDREWDILFVTIAGTLLAQLTGSLPQWRAEKLPNQQKKWSTYALTQGNGSREVVVIRGQGNCLDLEELSASQTPRRGTVWEKFGEASERASPETTAGMVPGELRRSKTWLLASKRSWGAPLGFWLTRVVIVVQSALWLLLFINVATPRTHNWVLLGVGAIGMFQNGVLAAVERRPELRNLPLKHVQTLHTPKKVMDVIMDFETMFGNGKPLLKEFFPGALRPAEAAWWMGQRNEYDSARRAATDGRTNPASQGSTVQVEEGLHESTKIEN